MYMYLSTYVCIYIYVESRKVAFPKLLSLICTDLNPNKETPRDRSGNNARFYATLDVEDLK